MRKVNINAVDITGFRSFKNQTMFLFEDTGLNLLRGPNGAGKTSLIEAVYWCLTGENLKGDRQDALINYESKSCIIAVTLNVDNKGYVITRTLGKKNILSVITAPKGIEINALHKKDKQEFINDLIQLTPLSLLNTIVFGQRMKRLVESQSSDKRQLFEELFELNFIETAKSKAKEYQVGLDDEVNQLQIEYDKVLKSEKNLLNLIEQKTIEIDDFEAEKKIKLYGLKTKIKSWTKELNSVIMPDEVILTDEPKLRKTWQSDFDKAKKIYVEENNKHLKFEHSLENANTELQQCLSRKVEEGICPKCFQKVNEKHAAQHLKEEADEVREKIKELEEAVNITHDELKKAEFIHDGLENEYKQFHDENNTWKLLKKDYENYLKLIEQKKKQIININKALQENEEQYRFEKESTPPDDNRKELRNKLSRMQQSAGELKQLIEEVTTFKSKVSWWVKTGFGQSGLKAYVFKYMLSELNKRIAIYSNRLGIGISFGVDLNGAHKKFETVCKMPGNITRGYSSLSGGEKTRVDIAIAFGMFDLLKSTKTQFNVLFLDEVFENLDETGMEECFDLIRMISEDTAVYMISHRIIDSLQMKNYYIHYDNGSTTISK